MVTKTLVVRLTEKGTGMLLDLQENVEYVGVPRARIVERGLSLLTAQTYREDSTDDD